MAENKAVADFMKDLHGKAEKLSEVRKFLSHREEEYRLATDAAFTEERKLKEELLEALKSVGLKSIKVESGDSFAITPRRSFVIKNEVALAKWAELNKLVRPDKELIKKKLEILFAGNDLPPFAEVEVKESISYKAAKTAEEKSDAS